MFLPTRTRLIYDIFLCSINMCFYDRDSNVANMETNSRIDAAIISANFCSAKNLPFFESIKSGRELVRDSEPRGGRFFLFFFFRARPIFKNSRAIVLPKKQLTGGAHILLERTLVTLVTFGRSMKKKKSCRVVACRRFRRREFSLQHFYSLCSFLPPPSVSCAVPGMFIEALYFRCDVRFLDFLLWLSEKHFEILSRNPLRT